jgi:hypothetical protein
MNFMDGSSRYSSYWRLAGAPRGQRARDQHRTLPIRAIAARTCVAAVMAAGVVEAAVACSGQSVRKSTGTPPRATGFDDPPDTAETSLRPRAAKHSCTASQPPLNQVFTQTF